MNDIEQRIIANIPMQYTLNWLKGGGMVIQEGAFFPYKSGDRVIVFCQPF